MHRLRMGHLIRGLAIVWVPLLCAAEPDHSSREFDWGPLISRRQDVHGDMRLRILGPFFERAISAEGQTLTAVRPLASYYDHPDVERHGMDVLWPVAHYKGFRDERSVRVLLAYYSRFDVNDPESRYRVWVLPFYFQGRDVHGEEYMAVFPLGGRIHELLGQDRMMFVLFPLYGRSELNDIVSHNVLWPIISRTTGEDVYRFRVFPFYGQSRYRDRHNKKFVMWPFWTSAEWHYPTSQGSGYILFPLYGRIDLTDQQSWLVLPPFFRVSQGARQNAYLLPWPLFQRRTGEVNQTYLWPIAGQRRVPGVETRFFLWPVVHQERVERGNNVAHRMYVLPFYYSDVHRERADAPPPLAPDQPVPRGSVVSNYQKIWPLVSYRREGDAVRFRMLDLWPLKQTAAIERNYAPIWTLIQNTRVEDRSDTEIFWGLYRRETRGEDRSYTSLFPLIEWERDERDSIERRRWSLLKGLIGYEREDTKRRYRALYILRWGGRKESQP